MRRPNCRMTIAIGGFGESGTVAATAGLTSRRAGTTAPIHRPAPGCRWCPVLPECAPGREWIAEVESLSPASGSEFALIPAQNASGNWVKVVQRVPVRLRLLPTEGNPPLRSGMSAEVWIDTQAPGQDSLPDQAARPVAGRAVAGQPVASRPAQ